MEREEKEKFGELEARESGHDCGARMRKEKNIISCALSLAQVMRKGMRSNRYVAMTKRLK